MSYHTEVTANVTIANAINFSLRKYIKSFSDNIIIGNITCVEENTNYKRYHLDFTFEEDGIKAASLLEELVTSLRNYNKHYPIQVELYASIQF